MIANPSFGNIPVSIKLIFKRKKINKKIDFCHWSRALLVEMYEMYISSQTV